MRELSLLAVGTLWIWYMLLIMGCRRRNENSHEVATRLTIVIITR